MIINKNFLVFTILFVSLKTIAIQAQKTIEIKHSEKDMTLVIREALENVKEKNLKLVFEKGIYKFLPEYALSKYSFITNHGNGYKRIIFRFEDFDTIDIEGNGSEFIFNGLTAPFQFENCKKITIKNLTIDWDIPLIFQAEVTAVNEQAGYFDAIPFKDGYNWLYKNDKISFPDINDFSFKSFGHAHCFDKETKATAHGAWGLHLNSTKIEKLDGGVFRFYEKLKHYPPVGCILAAKGEKELNRYAPAFQTQNSANILIDQVIIHHALGMGFLFERTENIKITNSGVYTRDGSDRYISSTADATHFANCKGDILIENCRIEGMLDDGTNVHGTYVTVNKIIDEYTVRVAFQHFEQMGFEFAGVGDEIWFIKKPSPDRAEVNTVTKVNMVNEKYTTLKFKDKLPTSLKTGDVLENKTWNPSFTMRGCRISKHRARNMMLKTPYKILIENNYLSSEMSSIMLRGEMVNWYESGAVEDLIIRNNHFENCAHGGAEHAVFYISPKFNKGFNQNEIYDRNIIFEDNIIETFDNRVVWALRSENLTIRNNHITQTTGLKQLYPEAYLFHFENCKNVELIENSYQGTVKTHVMADKSTKETLQVKNNKGFDYKN
ncbi:right-handed parallel beta-helix repeat-containing protein [Aquimarina sp. ERC-38]|uniref:alpha-1,3-galactosidase-related protein n=1 Tax=Aquimarina sp. ERC-38 TaxID=2949996 RepID=UPI00224654F1|nr:right-handed parallel beta-helix repeat-containing protein [Aquimarina sp. ERC-38]UZO82212.1 right-handed parallel beta-helix repeat-containing protein [Aquimarina sp. ERC-38]